MRNSKFVKLVLITLIGVMLLTLGTSVFAADSDSSYRDLADAVQNNTSNNATDEDGDDDEEENEANNTAGNATLNTSGLRNNTSNLGNTGLTSNIYNNTNLPKTGVADSVPVVALIVIFGVSAVYAYKKVKDYRSL